MAETARHLPRDVTDFGQKLARVQASLARPYTGPVRVIHGDFFPGNLLVDDGGQVAGLLDFGLFTMAGDPLFDLATAWVFFDMYDERRADLRGQLLDAILQQYGAEVRGSLYRYVLIYSLLSANVYAPDCTDGHYRWCVDNLNNPVYWQGWT